MIGGLKEFMDDIPGLSCSFDTGNFIMEHEDELEAFTLFKDKLCTLHLKDRSKTPPYEDARGKLCRDGSLEYVAAVGSGYIRIPKILTQLKKMNYSGNIIVELYEYSHSHMLEGIRDSVKWTKKMLEQLTD